MFGLLALGAAVFSGSGVATAQDKPAASAPRPAAAPAVTYHEMIEGNPKAKVTVVEFASLTCPHCARFQRDVYPEIKKNYIDTGKIRYVYKDYPLDELALVGAVLARCAPADQGLKLVDTMFKNQDEWAQAEKPIVPLKGYAQLAGMSGADVDACFKNRELLQTVKDEYTKATTLYQVQTTPTFFIGDEKIEGGRLYDDISKAIDKQIATTK
jgi:protein-disulfide isomerase